MSKVIFRAHPNCLCSLEDTETHKSVKVVDILPEKTNPGPVPKLGGPVVQAVFDDDEDEEEDEKAKNSDIEQIAMKDTLQEEFYTGFTYTSNTDGDIPTATSPTTYDFGSTLVQVSPVGDFVGSSSEGLPVKEHVTIESLRNVVKNISDEILVDVDHQSETTSDTKAQAWASDFKVIDTLGPSSGLYARLKWTKSGRELVENREYRFLSPVWSLNENNEPVDLKSIALTNRPALKGIAPIINSEPKEEDTEQVDQSGQSDQSDKSLNESNQSIKFNTMDKEILELVGIEAKDAEVSPEEKEHALSTIKAWKEVADKAIAEKKEAEIRNSYEEACKNMDLEDTADLYELYKKDPESFEKLVETIKASNKPEVKEEAPVENKEETGETVEQPKNCDEQEVISADALNSSPKVPSELTETLYDKAMKLHGEEFLNFIKSNKIK